MDRALDDIVSYITNTSNYKKCILIKEKMHYNEEICSLVEKVKTLQKKYVKNQYLNDEIKKELDITEKRLNEIPIYLEYMQNLERVNFMIEFIKDEINDYFVNLLSMNIQND